MARVYYYSPETGVYQGEDFLDEREIDSTKGVTLLEPPLYGRGEVLIFDLISQCWNLVNINDIKKLKDYI